jgi:formamidopyrimidine-DNA glycosylase
VPELPEVEALAADLRERAVGRVIDQAFIAEFSVLKTYDPPLTALHDATVSGTSRRGKFLDLIVSPPTGGPQLHLVTHLARAGWLRWRES